MHNKTKFADCHVILIDYACVEHTVRSIFSFQTHFMLAVLHLSNIPLWVMFLSHSSYIQTKIKFSLTFPLTKLITNNTLLTFNPFTPFTPKLINYPKLQNGKNWAANSTTLMYSSTAFHWMVVTLKFLPIKSKIRKLCITQGFTLDSPLNWNLGFFFLYMLALTVRLTQSVVLTGYPFF